MNKQSHKISRNLLLLIFLLVTVSLFWCALAYLLPTFDLDESLYRRAAQEMKSNAAFWAPTWDQKPLHHKPPFFFWLIWMASLLLQEARDQLSALAAHLPSLLASIGILITLHRASRKNNDTSAAAWYILAPLPVLTGVSAIFDPIQTLLLLPYLLIMNRHFETCETIRTKDIAILCGSLTAATLFKGLNGLIIPGLAFVLHSLPKIQLKLGVKIFLPAILLSAAGFMVLDQFMGRAFTNEFFWIHHFGRSQAAMETHGGSIFYYPLVLLFGGALMIPAGLEQVRTRLFSYRAIGFPVSFVFSVLLLFTVTATKLPHYTWPLWPALALFFSRLEASPAKQNTVMPRGMIIAWLPSVLLGLVVLLISANPVQWMPIENLSTAGQKIIPWLPRLASFEQLLLVLAAAALILPAIYAAARRKTPSVLTLAMCAIGFVTLTSFTLMPHIENILVKPQQEIGAVLAKIAKPSDCIRYAGPHSPSLSLAISSQHTHNRCEPGEAKFLVVPDWKIHECTEMKMKLIHRHAYLNLCGY